MRYLFLVFFMMFFSNDIYGIVIQNLEQIDNLVQKKSFFFAVKEGHYFIFTNDSFVEIPVSSYEELKQYSIGKNFIESYGPFSIIIAKQLEVLSLNNYYFYVRIDTETIPLTWLWTEPISITKLGPFYPFRFNLDLRNIRQQQASLYSVHFGWMPAMAIIHQKLLASFQIGGHGVIVNNKNSIVLESLLGMQYFWYKNYFTRISYGLQIWNDGSFFVLRPQVGHLLYKKFYGLDEASLSYTIMYSKLRMYEISASFLFSF